MHLQQNNPFLEQEIDLREYLRVIVSRKWVIISCTVILCTLALIRVFMMRPIYESSTKILIHNEAPKILNIQEVTPESFVGREYYQTQYKILKSRAIADRVNRELGGYKPYSEWTGRKKETKKPIAEDYRIAALLNRVSVRPVPNTQLVSISVEDVDPGEAAKIANLWAENYISYILDTKFNASQYASGWLQQKIEEAKVKLEDSEIRLQEYRKKNRILANEDESGTSIFDQLLQKKSELEIELSESKEYFKDKHPEIIGLKSEIESVQQKIESERKKELDTSEKEIKYNILKREVNTNKDIYKSLLERVGETEVTGELRTTNVSVVDKAIVPRKPAKPKKKQNLLIAFLIGIFGGCGLAFLIESLDQSLKTPEDIKNHIGIPSLASIALPQKKDDEKSNPEFICKERPKSTISESYRSLRTSIMFTAVEHRRKTLLLTSSGPQEGKTTTAINLAIVAAQSGEKTILVDADLRKPRIEKAFNIDMKHGLSEVLSGAEKLDTVIHKTDLENLDVIACGTIPPNPSELLGSKKMEELLARLSDNYDRIVIDTPPVLAVTDAVVLAGKVDGAIIVVKAGETNRKAAHKTREILESVGKSNVLGAVLNMVETQRSGGHYYYYQYYGRHGKYGDDNPTA